ncbi:MAG: pentapeptide repeat-containing protein [Spirochaetes bacterium]|nr:pentapeptide repeat-containing protein [Spirochaetota bacterium]
MCKYFYDGWGCPYEKLPDSEYCIFHLKDDNKDIEEFNKGINEILETDETVINFTGFYFPPNTADFKRKLIRKNIIFDLAQFSGMVNFAGVIFSKYASFDWAKFFNVGNFINTNFKGKASFEGAEFSEVGYFKNSKFKEDTNFQGAKFSKDAFFTSVDFSGDASFEVTKFSGNTYFERAKFSGNSSFKGINFVGIINFNNAIFYDKPTFFQTVFSGDALFNGTRFLGKTNFNSSEFLGKTSFVNAEFLELVTFLTAIFDGKTYFSPFKSKEMKFENTFFSNNVRIKANLSQCCFNGSNIERVDLSDSTWSEQKNQGLITKIYNYFFNSSITICEASQGELASNWKKLEGIYRRLKQSYQKSGDYETAGKFYFQEMECKRKQLGYFHRQFQNVFYRGFCGYGEKPFNVVLISIITMFAFAISYFYNGIEINGTDTINYRISLNFFDFSWVNDFLWSFYTSIITFTTLGYGDVHPVGLSRVFASIESLIGIFMTALFIFVFTRKMLR